MELADLTRRAGAFAAELAEVKAHTTPPSVGWYPPMLPFRLETLEQLLPPEHRHLLEEPSGPVADIGAADGDLGFFLAREGFDVDLFDGYNRPSLLVDPLNSTANVHQVHLDHDFELPRRYELAFLLHVLYHVRNPMLTLDTLSDYTRYLVISTRIANYTAPHRRFRRRANLRDAPLAYLLDPYELSPTDVASYWIFTETGLRRIATRCGWELVTELVEGDTTAGAADLGQARMWCLLRSQRFPPS